MSEKVTINDVNFDQNDPSKIVINSPKSIEAARLCGISIESLYKLPFKEYLDRNFSFKLLTPDIQKVRYDHYNEKRLDAIKALIIKREELISNKQTSNQIYGSDISTAVKNEKEKLEKLKRKQITDLQSMIDYEFQLEETRKKNEQKQLEQDKKLQEISC